MKTRQRAHHRKPVKRSDRFLRDFNRKLSRLVHRAFVDRDAEALMLLGELAREAPSFWPIIVQAVAGTRAEMSRPRRVSVLGILGYVDRPSTPV